MPLRSPELRRVSYLVTSRGAVDEAVGALANVPGLQTLELIIKNCTLCSDQLRQIGERRRWGRRDVRRGRDGWVGWVGVGLVGSGGAEDEAPRALAFIIMKNCKPCSDQCEPGWWVSAVGVVEWGSAGKGEGG